MKKTAETVFTIGTLATRTGVSVDTIRFYEGEGILPEPHRSAAGYRQYDETYIKQLSFVTRAKQLGFSLEEIRQLSALEADFEAGVEGVKQRAQQRLGVLNQRIMQMVEVRDALQALIAACPGEGDPAHCPILSNMHGDASTLEVKQS